MGDFFSDAHLLDAKTPPSKLTQATNPLLLHHHYNNKKARTEKNALTKKLPLELRKLRGLEISGGYCNYKFYSQNWSEKEVTNNNHNTNDDSVVLTYNKLNKLIDEKFQVKI